MRSIDINTWKRKEHFTFFSQFDEPFFGIVSEIDCTIAFNKAKDQKLSFFAYYLHKVLLTINKIEEFRYRIDGENVVLYDAIHASATIGRKDETFAFSFVEYSPDFSTFMASLSNEIEAVKNSKGLRLNEVAIRNDVIHFSSIPWVKFTGLTHSRNFKFQDSAPKISVGKIEANNGKIMMPVSVNAYHGFVDGLHVGKFFDLFQKHMNE
jgi:chloramphenicol O-acetyltransferase type A